MTPSSPTLAQTSIETPSLAQCYAQVRAQTDALVAHLEPEDLMLQPVVETSPAKWHLAHTTWFFETFVLTPAAPGRTPAQPQFNYLFNSYYNAVGERLARDRRGLLSRPNAAEVRCYRAAIDAEMIDLLEDDDRLAPDTRAVVTLGLNHEQQHQELLVTDLKHGVWFNPLRPAIWPDAVAPTSDHRSTPIRWLAFPAGLREIGHTGEGFSFDNEGPRHRVHLDPFELADRPVTCGEYLQFMADGGYERPELWLSDGWATVRQHQWNAPLYWEPAMPEAASDWTHFTAAGMRPVDLNEPVCHLSFYEADAYARWLGARLPTEAEWETALAESPAGPPGEFLESGRLHPSAVTNATKPPTLHAALGGVWEWTASPYIAYPGFRPAPGALGEYNGKFMCNQMILRGGSCATPAGHIRPTYRNFFPPEARWQFTGLRPARDV